MREVRNFDTLRQPFSKIYFTLATPRHLHAFFLALTRDVANLLVVDVAGEYAVGWGCIGINDLAYTLPLDAVPDQLPNCDNLEDPLWRMHKKLLHQLTLARRAQRTLTVPQALFSLSLQRGGCIKVIKHQRRRARIFNAMDEWIVDGPGDVRGIIDSFMSPEDLLQHPLLRHFVESGRVNAGDEPPHSLPNATILYSTLDHCGWVEIPLAVFDYRPITISEYHQMVRGMGDMEPYRLPRREDEEEMGFSRRSRGRRSGGRGAMCSGSRRSERRSPRQVRRRSSSRRRGGTRSRRR